MQVLYLGISGTLHPSESTYQLVEGRSPWSDGHLPYEAAPWLAQALEGWRSVRLVLTSTQPWSKGLPAVLEMLGPALASRVVGFTYEDLTTQPVHRIRTRSGSEVDRPYNGEDYWRMNKSAIVAAHVAWLKPQAWVAVDDEDILWPQELRSHVCIVDGCRGLGHPEEQDRLLTCLAMTFGTGRRAPAHQD